MYKMIKGHNTRYEPTDFITCKGHNFEGSLGGNFQLKNF